MRILFCFSFLLFCSHKMSFAQQAADTAVKKETPVLLSPYRFPVFTPGMVFLRNKDTVAVYLNYNFIRNEMHFTDEQGDTLILKEPLTVAKITIDEDEFYFYKEKWIQKVEAKAGIVLGYWSNVSLEVNPKRSGFAGYGQLQPSQWDYSNFRVSTRDIYFFGDGYGNFTKANKASLLSYFEKQAPLIKQYLGNHPINFNKLSDLQQLLHFCDTLQ